MRAPRFHSCRIQGPPSPFSREINADFDPCSRTWPLPSRWLLSSITFPAVSASRGCLWTNVATLPAWAFRCSRPPGRWYIPFSKRICPSSPAGSFAAISRYQRPECVLLSVELSECAHLFPLLFRSSCLLPEIGDFGCGNRWSSWFLPSFTDSCVSSLENIYSIPSRRFHLLYCIILSEPPSAISTYTRVFDGSARVPPQIFPAFPQSSERSFPSFPLTDGRTRFLLVCLPCIMVCIPSFLPIKDSARIYFTKL